MNSNSLVEYLESEIEKLKEEIENKKNRHYVNQNIIKECRENIKEYMDKEDSVFSLLSPISVESSYKLKIAEQNKIIEETNNENLLLISEIDECKDKIEEIERQLNSQKTNTEIVTPDEADSQNKTETPDTDYSSDESYGEDWISFINVILGELKTAEECCYSNPKECKDRISNLKKYIEEMCFGEG